MQQYIAALDFQCFCNLRRGIRRADRGARDSQVIASLKQEIQHRSTEPLREILNLKHIFG